MTPRTTLVVVESPAKARKVEHILRAERLLEGLVRVRACLGHLRDLPQDALGVDVAGGFVPQYQPTPSREKVAHSLRPTVRWAQVVYLATDPDREGEAVAWHFTKEFRFELRGKSVWRTPFDALTPEALREALTAPRLLDMNLVQAAVARRVVDRLIGYHISPRLWAAMKNRGKGFSFGRVQIAALHLLAEGEHWEVVSEWET